MFSIRSVLYRRFHCNIFQEKQILLSYQILFFFDECVSAFVAVVNCGGVYVPDRLKECLECHKSNLTMLGMRPPSKNVISELIKLGASPNNYISKWVNGSLKVSINEIHIRLAAGILLVDL